MPDTPGNDRQDHTSPHSLQGRSICLLFEQPLAGYSRVMTELQALQDAGAVVHLVTSHHDPADVPLGLDWTYAPLLSRIRGSENPSRPVRILVNLWRNALRSFASHLNFGWSTRARRHVLADFANSGTVFWVVDYPSLPSALKAARGTMSTVVYETLDLVPEFSHMGRLWTITGRIGEHRSVGAVDGFVTAGDAYADYYMEHYGDVLRGRPLVCVNAPQETVERPSGPRHPRRLVFLGALMFDRPVMELIDAMSLVSSGAVLTFQGANLIGDAPARRIRDLGLEDRVFIAEPCPPDRITEAAAGHDIGVVALRGDNENERRAPTTKLFTYMAAGLAVLGSALPGIAAVVERYDNGRLVHEMTPQSWAEAIDSMASLSDEELLALKKRSLHGARENAWEPQRAAFLGVFERAAQRADARR